MNEFPSPQFLTLLVVALAHTVALVRWGTRLTAAVENHGEKLEDHEDRLRKGKL
jgi:hypothetical protein